MKIYITVLMVLIVAVFAAGSSVAQDDSNEVKSGGKNWPPKAYPLARYESAWSTNPFNLKTVPVPVEATVPLESFAKDLAVAGVSQVGEEIALILIDRRTSQYHRVTKEPNSVGLRLVSLQNNPDIRKVVARIAKGADEAEIRYAETTTLQQKPRTRPADPNAGPPSGRERESAERSRGASSDPANGRK